MAQQPVSGNKALEALAVKRAKITDADKVRYRVYRAADDFVAVIAESALMAMKVSGIANPYRIVRDLPNEQAAIEAQRIAREDQAPPVAMALTPMRDRQEAFLSTELAQPVAEKAAFVPMQAKDFQKKRTLPWARVLTPEMVEQAKAKAQMATSPTPPLAQPAPPPAPAMASAPAVAPAPTVAAPNMPPEKAPTAAMPIPEPTAPPPAPAAAATPSTADDGVLSAEQVEQLLNG